MDDTSDVSIDEVVAMIAKDKSTSGKKIMKLFEEYAERFPFTKSALHNRYYQKRSHKQAKSTRGQLTEEQQVVLALWIGAFLREDIALQNKQIRELASQMFDDDITGATITAMMKRKDLKPFIFGQCIRDDVYEAVSASMGMIRASDEFNAPLKSLRKKSKDTKRARDWKKEAADVQKEEEVTPVPAIPAGSLVSATAPLNVVVISPSMLGKRASEQEVQEGKRRKIAL